MGLEIRIPIGLLFAIVGGILLAYGLATDAELYRRSLGIDVNAWWGAALLVFGGAMLALARRAARRAPHPLS
ncbi:MAG TPA: hypothetical protein VFD92_13885 [Candidatus Binatia bacterium]|nr:hypothetical protein [Candidatus Binatia bacterium]